MVESNICTFFLEAKGDVPFSYCFHLDNIFTHLNIFEGKIFRGSNSIIINLIVVKYLGFLKLEKDE